MAADQSTTGVPRMPHSSAIVVGEHGRRSEGDGAKPRVPLEHGFIRPFDGHRAAQAFDQVLGDHHLTTVVHAISEQSANDEDRLTDLLLRREPDVAEGSRHPLNRSPLAQCGPGSVPRFRNDDGRLGPATERHGGSIGFGIEEEEPIRMPARRAAINSIGACLATMRRNGRPSERASRRMRTTDR